MAPQEPEEGRSPKVEYRPPQCDVCDRDAKYFDIRWKDSKQEKNEFRLQQCREHHELVRDYKPPGRPGPSVDDSKRIEWLKQTDDPEMKALGERLMFPERDGLVTYKRLTYQDIHRDDLGHEPPGRHL
ncbi:hypothetical protein GCM10023258_39990 [Terrabacter aeriphilus]|uniref:Uncharacterized protein n=1 Tax=Terrabacter aeriphilus TaxID=515662 RepID=A0ABP9JNB6_9MICO